jgi:upstream activation factor subunit UAF30
MAKKTTSTKTSVESTATASVPVPVVTTSVATPVELTNPSVAPVKEKKAKVTKTVVPKVEASSSSTVTTNESPVIPPLTTENEVVEVDELLNEQSIEFVAKLQQLGTLISSLKTEFRGLEKKWSRELKTAQKQSSKRKRKSGNRAPSGFVKPTRISDELSSFLAKPVGSEMARTEVTREINKYIRTHNLQDKTNGRKIIPDAKLATLLKLKKTDELTYFNLQKYMSPHFAKAVNNVTPVPAPVVASV